MKKRAAKWIALFSAGTFMACEMLFGVMDGGMGLSRAYAEAKDVSEERASAKAESDFIIEGGMLRLYKGSGGDVVIPEGVTSIGEFAFWMCSGVTSVSIPEGVTSIGEFAFDGCGMTSVSIPSSVTSIGEGAFRSCHSLTSVTIPKGVTSIEPQTFSGCGSLTNISIPEGVTSIGEGAFGSCHSLTSISIPEGVTSIGERVFGSCSSLTSLTVSSKNPIYDSRENCNAIIETKTNTLVQGCNTTIIPEGVTSIGNDAFADCGSLTSVSIPEGVTSIGNDAFSSCKGLTSVSIPEGVTSIGNDAFYRCESLTSISIPSSVTSIGMSAFADCGGLTSITVSSKNPIYDSRENCNAIIETKTNTLVRGCNNTIIPEEVTTIGNYAFSDCKGLTSLIIPPSVTSIGMYAFFDCRNLTSLIIPSSVTSIGMYAFGRGPALDAFDAPATLYLYVEKDSYAEQYAIEEYYKYRVFSLVDASTVPALSKEAMEELVEKNTEADIIIKANNNVIFTFEKGGMKAAEDVESYDFTTTIMKEYDPEALPADLEEKDFILKIDYKYSGKLPGKASIRIPVGAEYAGKHVCYALLNEDGTYGEQQNATVDAGGYITVTQEHCSAYIVTVMANKLGDTNGDGDIDAKDALVILKKSLGLNPTGFIAEAADVNHDGDVDAKDALMVLKHSLGILTLS